MSALERIKLLLLGGRAGSTGQIARAVVGITNPGQHATNIGASTSDVINVQFINVTVPSTPVVIPTSGGSY